MSRAAPSTTARRVCAVVVTYFPGEELLANVAAIAHQVHGVLIVDNGSTGPELDIARRAAACPGVTLVENGRNRGVATALNQGMAWAVAEGFGCAVTLDQEAE